MSRTRSVDRHRSHQSGPEVGEGLDAFSDVVLDDEAIRTDSELGRKQSRPQASVEGPIHGISDWRRTMVEVTVRRALKELRDAS